jgi:hypothetical protein
MVAIFQLDGSEDEEGNVTQQPLTIFVECFEKSDLRIEDQADLVRKYLDQYGDSYVVCDYGGGGAALIRELVYHGIMAVKADKSAGSVLAGIAEIQNQKIGYIGKNLEREYLAYQHQVNRVTGEVQPQPQDGNDHLMDALRYGYFKLGKADKLLHGTH